MKKVNITLQQGSTLELPVLWEQGPLRYVPITGVPSRTPLRLTAVGHGIPDGWPVALMGLEGMRELNCEGYTPLDGEFFKATRVNDDTIELNDVNAVFFKQYTSGGAIVLYSPVDLTDYTARMEIKDRVGGTVLLALTTANNGIVIDNTGKRITIIFEPIDTITATWTKAVYDLELVSGTGKVTKVIGGTITLSPEVTTIS